ncbi:MAG: hypothetical protein ACPGWR_29415 [Ardenticatenaceae bacterium]
MYETAIPDDTKLRLKEMAPSRLVVGIPSYRNSRTVSIVVEEVAAGLDRYYATLEPVMVHVDGHSFDKTLSIASHVPLPDSVRRIATRYQGLSGKGSALRVIFEIATELQAEVVLLVEADVVSFLAEWVPKLVEPVLRKEAEMVLPIYQHIEPLMARSDLIIYPVLASMFKIPLRQPTGGEVAIAGGVARFFAERDVWETAVAQGGVDVWMSAQVAFDKGRLGQVYLGSKRHRSQKSYTHSLASFLQEIGTLFRLAYLHERAWRRPHSHRLSTFGEAQAQAPAALSAKKWPDPLKVWRSGKQAIKKGVRKQWLEIMLPPHLEAVEVMLNQPDEEMAFDDRLWARLVYDFIVVYNLGEGDPDKVVTSLYPLYLLRHATMLAEASRHDDPHMAYDTLVQRQLTIFHDEFDYLLQRWDKYIPPEQIQLWRELGLLPK